VGFQVVQRGPPLDYDRSVFADDALADLHALRIGGGEVVPPGIWQRAASTSAR